MSSNAKQYCQLCDKDISTTNWRKHINTVHNGSTTNVNSSTNLPTIQFGNTSSFTYYLAWLVLITTTITSAVTIGSFSSNIIGPKIPLTEYIIQKWHQSYGQENFANYLSQSVIIKQEQTLQSIALDYRRKQKHTEQELLDLSKLRQFTDLTEFFKDVITTEGYNRAE